MSNLLDLASIVLTPTAYNNGEALCIKPDDGSGDFQFSRNSAATRVNAQGLVENVQILSSNLVQNGDFSEEGVEEVSNGSFSQEGVQLVVGGDFSNPSDWTISGQNLSISNGKGISTGSNFGAQFKQSILTINKTYKLVFDIVDYTSGAIGLTANYYGVQQTFNSVGTHTAYFTSLNQTELRLYSENFIGSIDNVSVREVGQDWNLGTGWSIGEDKLNFTNVNGSSNQSSVFVIGKTYKITVDYTFTSGTRFILPYDGSNYNSDMRINTPSSAIGYTYYYTPLVGDTLFTYSDGNGNGSITNISVKEVGQNWIVGSDWSIAENKAVSSGSGNNLQQTINILSNKTYKLTFDVISTSGILAFDLGGATAKTLTDSGSKEYYFQSVNTNNLRFYGGNYYGSVTNISVIEITDDTNLPRINYEGFSYQDALGSEEIVNGGFSNGSANWGSYITGSSTIVFTDVATLNIDASNSNVGIYQENVFTSGKQYKIVLKMKASSSFDAEILETQQASTISTIGSVSLTTSYQDFTFYFTATGSNDIFVHRKFNAASANQSISIDNVSVKEYLGQEVVPDSGCGSWLFEPQSTNLITQSNDLSQWIIQQNATVSSPTFVSPSGENNANLIDLSADTDARVVLNFGSASTEYTFSVYLKKHESDVNGTFPLAYYNGSNYIKTYVNLTDKWQRFSLTFTNPSGSVFGYGLSRRGTTSDETLTRCYAWGGQQEALSYPTSLIPTEGSTVTRNQDVCTNGGSLASINSTEGVLYAEIAALANDGTTRIISLSDGTTANRVNLFFDTTNTLRAFITGVPSIATTAVITDNNKVALKFKSGDISVWLNGTEVATSTSAISLSGLSNLSFNQVGSSLFFGKTKCLAVWKEALSDAELTELTTI